MPEGENQLNLTGSSRDLVREIERAAKKWNELIQVEKRIVKEQKNVSQSGNILGKTIKAVLDDGRELTVQLERVKSGYKATGATIDSNRQKMEKLRKEQERLNRAQQQKQEGERTQSFLRGRTTPEQRRQATRGERAAEAKQRSRVKDFAEANEIALGRVQQMWTEVSQGNIKAYSGKLGRLQEMIINLQKAQENLGATARRSNEKAAKSAQKNIEKSQRRKKAVLETKKAFAQQLATMEKVEKAAKDLDSQIRAATSKFARDKATVGERREFDKARNAVRDFVRQNKLSKKQINQVWESVSKGARVTYGGALGELQDRLMKVKQAQEKLGQTAQRSYQQSKKNISNFLEEQTKVTKQTEQAKQKTEEFLLSWRSAARIGVIQVFQQALSNFTQQIREGIDTAKQFLTAIAEIQTIDTTDLPFNQWSRSLRELADSWQGDLVTQTEAAYQALSNQVAEGAEVFSFMRESNALAIATVSDTATAVKALTGVINAFNIDASRAQEVSAQLFKTVELGRVRLDEMADTIGTIAVIASQVGVTFKELSSLIDTITIQGIKFDRAATQIRGLLVKLLKPTEAMKELFRELGVESGEAAIRTFGLAGFLRKLHDATNGNVEEVTKLVNRIRGLSGTLAVIKDDVSLFEDNTRKASDSLKEFDEAVATVRNNIGFKFGLELEKIKNFFTQEFGASVIKVIDSVTASTVSLSTAITTLSKVLFTVGGGAIAFFLARVVTLRKAWQFLSLAIAATPFARIATAVGVATSAVIGFASATGTAQARAREAFSKIRRDINETAKETQRRFANLVNNIEIEMKQSSKAVRVGLAEITGSLSQEIDDQQQLLMNLSDAAQTSVKNAVDRTSDLISDTDEKLNRLKESIKELREEITGRDRSEAQELFDLRLEGLNLKGQFDAITQRIKKLNKDATDAAKQGNKELFDDIRRRIDQLVSRRSSIIQQVSFQADTSQLDRATRGRSRRGRDRGQDRNRRRQLEEQLERRAKMREERVKAFLRGRQESLIKDQSEAANEQAEILIGNLEEQRKKQQKQLKNFREQKETLNEARKIIKDFDPENLEINDLEAIKKTFDEQLGALRDIKSVSDNSNKQRIEDLNTVTKLEEEILSLREKAIERVDALEQRKETQQIEEDITKAISAQVKERERQQGAVNRVRKGLQNISLQLEKSILSTLKPEALKDIPALVKQAFKDFPFGSSRAAFRTFSDLPKITEASADEVLRATETIEKAFDESGRVYLLEVKNTVRALEPIIEQFKDFSDIGLGEGRDLKEFQDQIRNIFEVLKGGSKEAISAQERQEEIQKNIKRLADELGVSVEEAKTEYQTQLMNMQDINAEWSNIRSSIDDRNTSLEEGINKIRRTRQELRKLGNERTKAQEKLLRGLQDLPNLDEQIQDSRKQGFNSRVTSPKARVNAQPQVQDNSTTIGDVTVNIQGGGNPQQTAKAVSNEFKRLKRREQIS